MLDYGRVSMFLRRLAMKGKRVLLIGVFVLVGLGVAGIVYAISFWQAGLIGPGQCPIPVPPIGLGTHAGSGELVFVTDHSSYRYSNSSPQAPVSDLRYELAVYHSGDDHSGSGEIIRQGPLDSLNTAGDFQFHDMEAEGEFSPGNDFFILVNPPPLTVQLRVLDPNGKPIAWNMIIGCI